MKLISTRICVVRAILLVLFSFSLFTALGQPDYQFKSGVLISGTDKQVGAVYKYVNIRAGVDAHVTLTNISAGITVVDVDAGSGYNDALQPTLRANANTNGYLEMYFQLFVAGTSTPYTALEMPVTCIDVDGSKNNDGAGNPVYEFDEVNLGGGAVDFTTFGGELMISQSGNWFIGKNTAGIDYPGRDTSAKVVMFTVINSNVSTFTIRVGIDNQSTIQSDRLRSVYFKKFVYSHFPLPLPKILEFNGNSSGNKVILNWKMESGGEWDQCVLERSDISGRFEPISFFLPSDATVINYGYTDNPEIAGNYYYRLKLKNHQGEIKYSNILAFKTGNEMEHQSLVVYPSIITSEFTVRFTAERNESNQLQIVDYSGRQVYSRNISLQKGINNITINDFSLQRGNFVIVVRSANKINSQKVIVQ